MHHPPLDSRSYPSTEALFTLSSAGPDGIQNHVSSGPEPSLFPGPGCPLPGRQQRSPVPPDSWVMGEPAWAGEEGGEEGEEGVGAVSGGREDILVPHENLNK